MLPSVGACHETHLCARTLPADGDNDGHSRHRHRAIQGIRLVLFCKSVINTAIHQVRYRTHGTTALIMVTNVGRRYLSQVCQNEVLGGGTYWNRTGRMASPNGSHSITLPIACPLTCGSK